MKPVAAGLDEEQFRRMRAILMAAGNVTAPIADVNPFAFRCRSLRARRAGCR
jgi:hypothetical protein